MCSTFAAAMFLLLTACTGATPPTADANRPFLVFFQEWSGSIEDSARATLTAAAERARPVPSARMMITAYAEPGGSAEANADVTRLRAGLISDTLEGWVDQPPAFNGGRWAPSASPAARRKAAGRRS